MLRILTFMLLLQDLLIRHTSDVMHCEKNIIEHLMNIMFGEEDTVDVRKDMEGMNIRSNLWPTPNGNRDLDLALAPYVMSP